MSRERTAIALRRIRPASSKPKAIALLSGLAAFALAGAQAVAGEATVIGERDGKDIVTVRVTETVQSKQALPIFAGISGKTAGAKSLSLLKVVIPPGGSAEAHVHKGYEFGDLSSARQGGNPLRRRLEEERRQSSRGFPLRSA